jgi:hypothetical protein
LRGDPKSLGTVQEFVKTRLEQIIIEAAKEEKRKKEEFFNYPATL